MMGDSSQSTLSARYSGDGYETDSEAGSRFSKGDMHGFLRDLKSSMRRFPELCVHLPGSEAEASVGSGVEAVYSEEVHDIALYGSMHAC